MRCRLHRFRGAHWHEALAKMLHTPSLHACLPALWYLQGILLWFGGHAGLYISVTVVAVMYIRQGSTAVRLFSGQCMRSSRTPCPVSAAASQAAATAQQTPPLAQQSRQLVAFDAVQGHHGWPAQLAHPAQPRDLHARQDLAGDWLWCGGGQTGVGPPSCITCRHTAMHSLVCLRLRWSTLLFPPNQSTCLPACPPACLPALLSLAQIAVGSLALVLGLAAGGTCDTSVAAWVIGGMYEAVRLPLVLLMVALHRRENIAKP